MLKILLNGSEFNSGREERQPPFSGLTRRHNTSSNTPTGILPTGWKAICLSALRRIKPTSETKLNSEEEPAGECNGLFMAAIKSTLLLGTSAKDEGMGFALTFLWQKANVQPTEKAVDDSTDLSGHWVDVLKTELLLGHYHTALCITDVSQLYLSVHVVKSPQLNSWAILSVHTASIFSLKQVWDHSSQIFFPWWDKLSYIVSPLPQAKSTVGDSHRSVADMRNFILQNWATVLAAEDFHCPSALQKKKTNLP